MSQDNRLRLYGRPVMEDPTLRVSAVVMSFRRSPMASIRLGAHLGDGHPAA